MSGEYNYTAGMEEVGYELMKICEQQESHNKEPQPKIFDPQFQ